MCFLRSGRAIELFAIEHAAKLDEDDQGSGTTPGLFFSEERAD
jgi:hypothetical protein